jgi:AcrR family transcriptional regulator
MQLINEYAGDMDNAPVPRTRREEYADLTRQALIDTARTVFTEVGYQQAGIEAIAQAARVTRGAFYHHFEDKKALFEALVISLQAGAADNVREKARKESDPDARVMAGATAFLDSCTEPAYRRLVLQEAPAVLGSARCREIGEAHPYGLLIAAVDGLHKAGRFDAANAYLAARMIGSMICEAALLLDGAASPKALKRQALAIVERVFAAFAVAPVKGAK